MNLIFYILLNIVSTIYSDHSNDCLRADSCQGLNQTYPRRWSQESYNRNCFCDANCGEYNECCNDAQLKQAQPQRPLTFPYQCMETYRTGKIYVKNLCRRDWPVDNIKANCEKIPNNESDIIKLIPVLDVTTNITYRNIFCAICNNAITRYLISWEMIITCPLTDIFDSKTSKENMEKKLQPLQFNNLSNFWEVMIKRPGKTDYLLKCQNTYVKISNALLDYQERFRSCKIGIVDSCPIDWKDKNIAENCKNHGALFRYSSDTFSPKTYRNQYCAICNNIDPNNLICKDNGAYTVVNGPRPEIIHFNLKFGFSESDKLVLNTPCPSGQIFDAQLHKCRHVTCGDTSIEMRGSCDINVRWFKKYTL